MLITLSQNTLYFEVVNKIDGKVNYKSGNQYFKDGNDLHGRASFFILETAKRERNFI